MPMKQRKATAKSRVIPTARPDAIAAAILSLRYARDELRKCGCKNAADYVARAMKSAEGAHRHAERRAMQEAK